MLVMPLRAQRLPLLYEILNKIVPLRPRSAMPCKTARRKHLWREGMRSKELRLADSLLIVVAQVWPQRHVRMWVMAVAVAVVVAG